MKRRRRELTGRLPPTPCPFCAGGSFSTADDDRGRAAVMHSMPPCQTFMRLDAGDFLHAARMKLIGPQPGDVTA